MAKRLDSVQDFVAHELSQQYVHGRALPLHGRTWKDEQGIVRSATRDPEHGGVLPIVATWSTRSILIAFRATATMMEWVIPDEIDAVLAHIEHMHEHPPGGIT